MFSDLVFNTDSSCNLSNVFYFYYFTVFSPFRYHYNLYYNKYLLKVLNLTILT